MSISFIHSEETAAQNTFLSYEQQHQTITAIIISSV